MGLKEKVFCYNDDGQPRTAKEVLVGDYDWGYLCKPQWPWCRGGKKRPAPQFFAVNAWLGIMTAFVMGFQHALAMIGGLFTVPYLIGFNAFNDKTMTTTEQVQMQQYLVSAALIVCGIGTAIQVTGFKLPYGRQWGAGILSVMGISFTTFPIANSTIATLMSRGHTFNEAYGYVLGTAALCGLVPVVISFFPIKAIKKIFPPVVCGVTIILIGINLTGTGMKSWGGGAACAGAATAGKFTALGGNCTYLSSVTNGYVNATNCYSMSPVLCHNGNVALPFGSGPYVGLGFSVFAMICVVELFGSPFLRNCSVIIGLLFGYMMAGVTRYDGQAFVTGAKIDAAPAITFLWVKTFPLKLYGPLVLPMLIVFCITSIETVGDVSATAEASFLTTSGPKHNKRIRAALLNDGFCGIFSALATSMPMTTFAQNNGVISLTAVASRQAGWACAAILFVLGVLGKVAGLITTIPDCVLGGMTTFLFANVIASGIKIIVTEHLSRRNRFIMACSLGLGIGVLINPEWATNNLWPCTGCNNGVKGLRDAIIMILSTGFCIGAITAMILNSILPQEDPIVVPMPTSNDLSVNSTKSFAYADTLSAPKQLAMDSEGEDTSTKPTSES